ncbi:hypothetical protein SEA_MAGRITTE_133 [Microbacterium phage Magritte]|nr:hypothetical protein SEA_MAGRITTE_133 [Microbacterium phage Magritte]
MSFLKLKTSEDRLMTFVFWGSLLLLAIGHGISYGWWAFLTVPLFIAMIYGIVYGLEALRRRAIRKDFEREVRRALEEAGLEPIEHTDLTKTQSTWARMWSPKRDR